MKSDTDIDKDLARIALQYAPEGCAMNALRETFRQMDVWMSPRGTLYRVVTVEGGVAVLGQGLDGRGRKIRRKVDAVQNWVYQPTIS